MGIVYQALRFARVCLEESFLFAHTRKTFGKRLVDHPVIRAKLAEMARHVEATQAMADTLTYQITRIPAEHAGLLLGGDTALLKVQATKTFELCAREAAQIFGGASYVRGGRGEKIERLYREVRAYAIPGGSEEIMVRSSNIHWGPCRTPLTPFRLVHSFQADLAVRQAMKQHELTQGASLRRDSRPPCTDPLWHLVPKASWPSSRSKRTSAAARRRLAARRACESILTRLLHVIKLPVSRRFTAMVTGHAAVQHYSPVHTPFHGCAQLHCWRGGAPVASRQRGSQVLRVQRGRRWCGQQHCCRPCDALSAPEPCVVCRRSCCVAAGLCSRRARLRCVCLRREKKRACL
jgi:hypothetical protein